MPNAVIAHAPDGKFDLDALEAGGARMAGPRRHRPRADGDDRPALHLGRDAVGVGRTATAGRRRREFHVVAIDYGIKRNILRLLAGQAAR